MLFDITHDGLVSVAPMTPVRVPEATARQYGFTGETLDFLVHVGLPNAPGSSFPFNLPDEFDPQRFWYRAAGTIEGWRIPDGAENFVSIGCFPVNAALIDPETGIIYQHTYATREAIPIHRDISSLTKTITSYLDSIESHRNEDEDEDDDEDADVYYELYYERLRGEVRALKEEIQSVDPLPFAHEYSEWVGLFEELADGIHI
ncbi:MULTISPECIES: SUKH-4 family immunity protein [Streptomyces]|uniref:SUKH-4 family immunity protein n=1 Tax=Streptomyces TaxID=1883 RepID=UPI000F73B16F|nr:MULTISPECIES: SUKH-4 family immunity protein [Streptomyces]RSS07232.1 hypothetical protein EF917_06185 [Streptomyces sp. WAC00469]GGV78227.1 hypothetical protein GCM10010499_38500 [Streptomyces thermoviolaceus subsp. apingens]